MNPRTKQAIQFAVGLFVIVVLQLFPILNPLVDLLSQAALRHSLISKEFYFAFWTSSFYLLTIAMLIFIVRFVEKRPWCSLGIVRPSLADPVLGAGACLIDLSLPLVPISQLLISHLLLRARASQEVFRANLLHSQ